MLQGLTLAAIVETALIGTLLGANRAPLPAPMPVAVTFVAAPLKLAPLPAVPVEPAIPAAASPSPPVPITEPLQPLPPAPLPPEAGSAKVDPASPELAVPPGVRALTHLAARSIPRLAPGRLRHQAMEPAPAPPAAVAPVPQPAARPAAVEAAAATPPTSAAAVDSFNGRLRAAVQAAVRYPPAARMMSATGRTRLSFTWRDGVASELQVVSSAGLLSLDDAACAAVRNAAYPQPPKLLLHHALNFAIWVQFKTANED